MSDLLLVDIQNRIGTITINRPEKRNALNPELVIALTTAFKELQRDQNVKVIILKAAGEVFSAGADLAYLQQLQSFSYDDNLKDSSLLKDLFSLLHLYEKPVIAQVEGHAIAGGCGLVTLCDIVFSVPEAKFGYTEVKIGFVPALVAGFLVRKVGAGRTRELVLSGELISAEKANEYGLVNFIASRDEIESEVLSYAEKMVESTSAEAIKTTKNLLSFISDLAVGEGLELAARVNATARLSADCQKGIAAFLNKEDPKW